MDMTVEQFEELGFAIGEQIKAEKKQKLIRKRTVITKQ
jgi:hypothetical protein